MSINTLLNLSSFFSFLFNRLSSPAIIIISTTTTTTTTHTLAYALVEARTGIHIHIIKRQSRNISVIIFAFFTLSPSFPSTTISALPPALPAAAAGTLDVMTINVNTGQHIVVVVLFIFVFVLPPPFTGRLTNQPTDRLLTTVCLRWPAILTQRPPHQMMPRVASASAGGDGDGDGDGGQDFEDNRKRYLAGGHC